MKNTHQCPKCESFRIVYIEGSKYSTGQNIHANKWATKFFSVERYICVDCGLVESYVPLTSDFNKWADKKIIEQGGDFNEFV